jgi:hypothetical protein
VYDVNVCFSGVLGVGVCFRSTCVLFPVYGLFLVTISKPATVIH